MGPEGRGVYFQFLKKCRVLTFSRNDLSWEGGGILSKNIIKPAPDSVVMDIIVSLTLVKCLMTLKALFKLFKNYKRESNNTSEII